MEQDFWIPRLVSGVQVSTDESGSSTVVGTPDDSRYFRLRDKYASVLHQVDGCRNLILIANYIQEINMTELRQIVLELERNGIVTHGSEFPKVHSKDLKANFTTKRKRNLSQYVKNHVTAKNGVFTWEILNLGRYEKRIVKGSQIFARTKLVYLYLVTILTLPFILFSRLNFFRDCLDQSFNAGDLAVAFLGIVISSLLHELAHAFCLAFYGGKVRGFGLMTIYGNPGFYCDISDSWKMSRRNRIVIALSGVAMNLFICSISLLTTLLFPKGALVKSIFIVGVFNGVIGVLNLFPFVKLDGYLVLVAATDISNLRDKSIRIMKLRMANAFGSKTPVEKMNVGLYSYAVLAFLSPYLLIFMAIGTSGNLSNDYFGLLENKFAWIILLSFVVVFFGKLLGLMFNLVKSHEISLVGWIVGITSILIGLTAITIPKIPLVRDIPLSGSGNSMQLVGSSEFSSLRQLSKMADVYLKVDDGTRTVVFPLHLCRPVQKNGSSVIAVVDDSKHLTQDFYLCANEPLAQGRRALHLNLGTRSFINWGKFFLSN